MFQSLTNKILGPHRHHHKDGESADTEKHEHHHHLHHHDQHDSQGMTPIEPVATKTEVLPTKTTTTHNVVDEGIVERETIVKPAIVDEKVRVDTLVEVQPILHRDIEQAIVHHVEQHVVEPEAPFVGGTVTNKPIIQEHVTTRVVDEITPIVHREIAIPKIEKVEEHVNERIVEPTKHTEEVKYGEITDKAAIIKPAIIDEKTRIDTVVEVQPIVHREVERVVINHIEKHIVEPAAPFVGGTVRKEAIVDEHVNTRASTEVQPVVHREIAVPVVEKKEEHLQENVVAPTKHTHAVSEKLGLASEVVHDKDAIVKPVILDEKIREDTVVEVQPIVHREIEKPVVHHIEQHIQEPAAPFVGGTVQNKPIIDEHVKTKVIDEIQPVVHKEKAVLHVEQKEEHMSEHLVAPTQHTHSTKTTEGHVADIAIGENTTVKPEIVKEKVRQDTVVEVQPIVHKEITQPVVHHIEEHIQEPGALNVGGTIRNKAIIDEHVSTNVVDEVQPVVHREIAVQKVEKVEQHLDEKVVLPTAHTQTVDKPITATSASPLPASTSSPTHSEKSSIAGKLHNLKHKVEEKKEELKEKKEEKKLEKEEKKEKEARGPAKVVSFEEAS